MNRRSFLAAAGGLALAPAFARTELTAPAQLNVAGSAQLQSAVDYVCSDLDLRRQAVVIQCADGIYTQPVKLFPVTGWGTLGGHNELTIRGNMAQLGNVLIDTDAPCFTTVGHYTPWRIEGFELRSRQHAVIADFESRVYVGKNRYGACSIAHLVSAYGSSLEIVDDYEVTGGGMFHWVAGQASKILSAPQVISISWSNFSQSFAHVTDNATVNAAGVNFVGGATGYKFYIGTGGGIQTGGASVDHFPGSIPGICIPPGWYG